MLHLAAKSGYLPICQILLLKGIDLAIRDANGLLAKQVTSNQQIKNLIEKYEELKSKNQGGLHSEKQNLVFEEIKEGEEEEDDEEGGGAGKVMLTSGDDHRNHDSPHDASGGGGYLPNMSGAGVNTSGAMYTTDRQPSNSLLDAIKREDSKSIVNKTSRPSTRFELAFQKR